MQLFDLQTECYHVLERLLVLLGRQAEALVVAERARTRAFVDHLHAAQESRNGNRCDIRLLFNIVTIEGCLNF